MSRSKWKERGIEGRFGYEHREAIGVKCIEVLVGVKFQVNEWKYGNRPLNMSEPEDAPLFEPEEDSTTENEPVADKVKDDEEEGAEKKESEETAPASIPINIEPEKEPQKEPKKVYCQKYLSVHR